MFCNLNTIVFVYMHVISRYIAYVDNDNSIIWLLLTPVTTNNLHFLLPLSVLNFFRVKSDYFLKGSLSEQTLSRYA